MRAIIVFFMASCCGLAFAMGSADGAANPATAIFVVNNAGQQYDQFLPTIKDNLISLLTQKGFSIVRTENAIPPEGLPDSNENKVTDPQKEASLNRLAESLNAKLLVVSTLNAVTHDENSFEGAGTIYKANVKTSVDSARINLQVYDLGSTKSVYGDSVSTAIRTPVYGDAQTRTILINLFQEASEKISENIASRVFAINASATSVAKKITFKVSTNVPSVDVFIDGMAVGSVGKQEKFEATPGIHQLKLGKEFLKSWEKTVNIADGASFNAQLELSAEGLKRFKDIEAFKFTMKAADTSLELTKKQADAVIRRSDAEVDISKKQSDAAIRRSDADIDIAKDTNKANIELAKDSMKLEAKVVEAGVDIAKEQSEAEAKSKVEISKGEREKRENSYIRDDGFVDNLKKLKNGD